MTDKLGTHFKVWLSSSRFKGAFGDGKWRLLDAIATEGSLRAAGEKLGISYRKAWGDLRKAEEALGISLVHRERGGSKGGGTGLTKEGERWLAAYGRFRGDIERASAKAYSRHIEGLLR